MRVGGEDVLLRGRVMVGALFLLMGVDAALVPVTWFSGSPVHISLLFAWCATVCAVGLVVLGRARDPGTAAWALNLSVCTGIVVLSIHRDAGPLLWTAWWAVVPLVAAGMRSPRAGVAWAGVVVVLGLALSELHARGVVLPVDAFPLFDLRVAAVSQAAAIALVGAMTWLTGRMQERSHRERSRLFRAVEERERLLDAVLESTSDLVGAFDPRGRLITANGTFQRFFGETGEVPVVAGTPLLALVPEGARERFARPMARLGEGDSIPVWVERMTVAGRERYLEIALFPIGHTEVLGFTLQARDITHRTEAEVALRTANQKVADLSLKAGRAESADGVLHNVGNVVSSVTVGVSMLDERIRDLRIGSVRRVADLLGAQADPSAFVASEKGARTVAYLGELGRHVAEAESVLLEQVQALHRDVDHVRRVLSTQQDYARQRSRIQVGSLHEVVEAALLIEGPSFARHDIALERRFEDLPDIALDRDLVMQVLLNLLNNARQAIKEHDGERRITVRTFRDDGVVGVAVHDTGHGIAASDLPRLFSHGFTTREAGHGFGLFSSLACARELGGDLVASSAGPGRGAEFVFTLPERRQLLAAVG